MPNTLIPHETTILIADGDLEGRQMLARRLEQEGFRVDEHDRSASLRDLDRHHRPTLMICTASQDTEDELVLLRRESWVPLILLTDGNGSPDLASLLDLGADDVVAMPFAPREVVARARATLRRAVGAPPSSRIVRGDLELDLRGRRVRVGGRLVELARREYDLLAFLAGHPGQVFSRGQLLQHVWGAEEGWQSEATVTEHVRRLRGRIGPAPDGADRIETVRSIGYRFRAEALVPVSDAAAPRR